MAKPELKEAHWRILEALQRGEQPTNETIAMCRTPGGSRAPSMLRHCSKLEDLLFIRCTARDWKRNVYTFELTDDGREVLAVRQDSAGAS